MVGTTDQILVTLIRGSHWDTRSVHGSMSSPKSICVFISSRASYIHISFSMGANYNAKTPIILLCIWSFNWRVYVMQLLAGSPRIWFCCLKSTCVSASCTVLQETDTWWETGTFKLSTDLCVCGGGGEVLGAYVCVCVWVRLGWNIKPTDKSALYLFINQNHESVLVR